jgi:regulator of sigma E protease
MQTAVSFVFAIGLLVAVHELGHYWVAVACGVKVLRFSIGFGPRLVGWTSKKSGTEFIVGLLPLGGYVKMLDEREGVVPPSERSRAFNVQSLRKRAAIVAAGPIANLLFAVLLYSSVNWMGFEQAQAVLSKPIAGSAAARVGWTGGENIHRVGFENEPLEEVASFEDFRWWLTRAALAHRNIQVEFSAAAVGSDTGQLRELIQSSGQSGVARPQVWRVDRAGQVQSIVVSPKIERVGDATVGRIGAFIGTTPALVTVRYGLLDGFGRALDRTWEVSALSLRMMGQMLVGDASLKNLSGPLTIADYAGKSASMGLTQFLVFLALISISLGVLNLLPFPVLDGGHLMYYLWESLTGKPVSESWMDRFQKVGLVVLLLMMSVALFNDVTRLLG